jgi:hypothetical protein
MKKFKYEQYDYSFLYSLLTEEQRESLQSVLKRFIGCPNTEATRFATKMAVEDWIKRNNIKLKEDIEISFE